MITVVEKSVTTYIGWWPDSTNKSWILVDVVEILWYHVIMMLRVFIMFVTYFAMLNSIILYSCILYYYYCILYCTVL